MLQWKKSGGEPRPDLNGPALGWRGSGAGWAQENGRSHVWTSTFGYSPPTRAVYARRLYPDSAVQHFAMHGGGGVGVQPGWLHNPTSDIAQNDAVV